MPKVPSFVLMFAPERWGQVDRFAKFASTTYGFDERESRAVAGVSAHFNKAQSFLSLAESVRPNLQIDEDELEANGYTPATNAYHLTTLVEACITEMYSCVDCTAQVIRAVYGKSSRGLTKSTRRLFTRPDEITGAFPDQMKDIIRDAGWYTGLLYLRDELTHLGTGGCHTDRETGKISYMHTGIKQGDRPLVIDDIFEWLHSTIDQVNRFLGQVFHFLCSTLNDGEIMQMCGIVDGRMLMRVLRTSEPPSFDSGICMSDHWFDAPDNPTCPMKDRCGAYARKSTPELRNRFYGE